MKNKSGVHNLDFNILIDSINKKLIASKYFRLTTKAEKSIPENSRKDITPQQEYILKLTIKKCQTVKKHLNAAIHNTTTRNTILNLEVEIQLFDLSGQKIHSRLLKIRL